MKIKQFQCVLAVVESGYSVTAAAERLFLSQPAVSKQIKLFEETLGKPIFRRQSKQFVGLTDIGEAILPELKRIMQSVEYLRSLAHNPYSGAAPNLTIATTNTLATYRLAPSLATIREAHPQLQLNMIEGTNTQALQMVQEYEADYAWFSATDLAPYATAMRGLMSVSGAPWSPVLVVPKGHEFNKRAFDHIGLLANYPLVTYVTSHKGLSGLAAAMEKYGSHANVVLTARNADLIKSYVRQGIGLGVIADMAYDEAVDSDLVCYSLKEWMPVFNTYLVWQTERHLRNHDYDFIATLMPSVDAKSVRTQIAHQRAQEDGMWTI